MKIKVILFGMLLFELNSSVQADVTFNNVQTYGASYGSGLTTSIVYKIDVLTPEGAYYGTYSQGGIMVQAGVVPNLTWTGPGVPPDITIPPGRAPIVDDSYCPGMTSGWVCHRLPVNVHVTGTTHGCPWVVTTSIYSTARPPQAGPYYYQGPNAHQSNCPTEPVASYDISWDENTVVHNKSLSLQSTGGVIEKSLPTFLMKDGRLCDGSDFSDDRGAYCRLVSQLMTFSVQGCDNNKVNVTANRHPVTDKQLHDMQVRVDTSERQSFDATCRFQYILNEL
ncbi:DUF2544 domain-containing protein [Escherichia coli]|nr:DUF2544 domain-containing protein [Escherichia coli]EEX6503952.1 DUF2544 domain-containing protein [Escherichia coli]